MVIVYFLFAAREETATTANDHARKPTYTLKPQPFTITKSEYPANVGYAAYNTYPTPQFNPYNNTQYQTSVNVPYQNNVYQTTPEAQYTYYIPNSEDINTKSDADDTNNLLSLQGSTGTPAFDDLTTTPIPLNNSVLKTDENLINELESSSGEHPPHIHSVDVQCSKDKMTINIEFNEVFNGIIYSKVKITYSFINRSRWIVCTGRYILDLPIYRAFIMIRIVIML